MHISLAFIMKDIGDMRCTAVLSADFPEKGLKKILIQQYGNDILCMKYRIAG